MAAHPTAAWYPTAARRPHTASDPTAKYRMSVWTGERRRDLLIVGLRVRIVGLRVLIIGADERKTA